MQAQIKLGRIFGIEIGLHYSWVIIALLIMFSLRANFSEMNPGWGGGVIWVSAIITGLFFFVTIILHELAHAVVAQARGLPVRSITLFALGGVAQIEQEAAEAKTEFWMAVAGPIMSFIISLVCLGAAWMLGWAPLTSPPQPLLAVLVWLGYINLSLAIFNLIPGFPLDGGRILRAIVWWVTGDAHRSTQIAAGVGQFVAIGLIMLGLLSFFVGASFSGLWLAFIGWFLLSAARGSYAQIQITERLRGVRVGDIMSRHCAVVDGYSNLQTFVSEYLLRLGQRCFIVVENGQPVGLITPQEVKEIPRAQWPYKTVDDVMRPFDQLHTVAPETPVTEALETMGRDEVNQLPVVSNGHLEGVFSRGNVLRLLQARAELKM